MSEFETLVRNLFAKQDTQTLDFKFFLGSNRDALIEEICGEVNKTFAQKMNGMLKSVEAIDGDICPRSVSEFVQAL